MNRHAETQWSTLPRPDLRRVLAGLALLLSALVVGCSSSPGHSAGTLRSPALERLEFNRPQMGVPFRIVVFGPPDQPDATTAAVDAAYARIAELNALLSDYDPDSELSRVCHDTPVGQAASVGTELWFMLERSQALAARTQGAFDITVGPMVNLWRRARRRVELPPEHLLAEARTRVGWEKLLLDPTARTVTFLAPSMRLDLGGIAKGYAADEALRVLSTRGFPQALVAAAGDITAGEPPPGQPGWRVEIGAIDLTNAPPPRQVWLRQASLATSGDLFQRLEIGGRRYSHIVDPRTGIGLTDHSLVTVLARDGTTADSLATAVSVLGPREGLALVEDTPGAAAMILRANGSAIETSESRRFHRWLAKP